MKRKAPWVTKNEHQRVQTMRFVAPVLSKCKIKAVQINQII